MALTAVEIEIDGPQNEALYFPPLKRSIRGRFDMLRVSEPQAKVRASEWPTAIPSQRVGIDDQGTGYIVEPLHDAAHSALREKIQAMPAKLEPAKQEFAAHAPTWLHFLKLAVESGIARVVKGKLPARIEGTPQTDFICQREPSTEDKLTAAIERQTQAFERLIEVLAKPSK